MNRQDLALTARIVARVLALCSFVVLFFATPVERYLLAVFASFLLAFAELIKVHLNDLDSVKNNLTLLRDSTAAELDRVNSELTRLEQELRDLKTSLDRPRIGENAPSPAQPLSDRRTSGSPYLLLMIGLVISAGLLSRYRANVRALIVEKPIPSAAIVEREDAPAADPHASFDWDPATIAPEMRQLIELNPKLVIQCIDDSTPDPSCY